MANKKISELPYINVTKISGNTLVPLVTYFSAATGDTVHTYANDLKSFITSGISGNFLPLSGGTVSGGTRFLSGLTANTISATTYFNLPSSTFSGGTVTGPTIFTNGLTANTISATTYQNLPTDIRVTGGTYSAGTISFINNTGGTFNVTGLTTGSTSNVTGDYLPLSGGTVTGATNFTSGLTANIISANTITITDNIDSTNRQLLDENGFASVVYTSQRTLEDLFGTSLDWGGKYLYKSDASISFDWENGILTGQTNIESSTISATTYLNLPTSNVSGDFLPLSGGTVTGNTSFTSGLTANTLNVTGLTQTKGITSTGGITFKQVTINSSYTATTDDYMIDVTGGTFTVSLPTAVGIQGRLIVVKNNGGGAVTVDPFGSETIDGKPFVILGETNTIQLSSNGAEWVALSYNISTVNSSTGVFEFTGMTIASPTTFTVAPIKGWIVDDTSNPLSPQLYYVTYSGGTHTATYVTATTATWVYLTSGGTISQSNIPITDQQRRQNIALGKLGHANKTNIINAFSQPDFVLSPLAQLRDMFEPINLINGGIKTSANGANLSFNTSAGYLHGLGINFANDTLNPNSLYVTGTAPCTFQYRTQTGGTASNTTFIDPTKKDVGGVVTTLSGTKATNQRIYLIQNGVFRVQYGQAEYNTLTQAIAGIATEQFVEFTNFTTNGILVGVLSVLSTATDLTDTTKAQFFNVSKFGDSTGAAGGSPTTNLQQAYNNSITPEITTDSTLGALSVKNGAGTLDNVTNVFEGVNSGGTTTSYVRADGFISGNSLNAPNLIISGGTQSIFSGNSSSDLVRITQTGTGNAFVVEDSTNPDSSPFVINSGGSVSIGSTEVFSVGTGTSTPLQVTTGSWGGSVTGLPSSTTVVLQSQIGSSIGMLTQDTANSQLYFGTPTDAFGAFLRWDYTNRNLILSTANGTGKLIFQTANAVEVARIDQSGNMGIGLTGATQKLEVSGNTLIYGTLSATTISATTISATTFNLSGSQIDSAWTSYVPVWTSQSNPQPAIGDGTITGYYKVIGKTAFVRVKLNWGTTTSGGNGDWRFSLPVNAASADGVQLPCSILDNGNNWYTGIVNGTYTGAVDKSSIITTASPSGALTANIPFTWGNLDSLQFNGSYEIA
jgi:hypothetical protein